jgi:hypothetical protein
MPGEKTGPHESRREGGLKPDRRVKKYLRWARQLSSVARERHEAGFNRCRPCAALLPVFPIMLLLTMILIILQVRKFSAMAIVLLTAPLGLIGVVPTLLLTGQPFGFNGLPGWKY